MHNYPARLLRRVGFKCPSAFAQGQLPKDKKGSHYWLYLFTCNLQQMHITLSAGRSINWQRAVTIYQQGCRVERLPRLQPVMMSSNTSNRPLKSRRSALCMCDGELGAEGGGGRRWATKTWVWKIQQEEVCLFPQCAFKKDPLHFNDEWTPLSWALAHFCVYMVAAVHSQIASTLCCRFAQEEHNASKKG